MFQNNRLGRAVLTIALLFTLVSPAAAGPAQFVRGDVNGDGSFNLLDATTILGYLFQGQAAICLDAMDIDDSGAVNIADVILLLNYLFTSGVAPQPPFPACGLDPTADNLDCMGPYIACASTNSPPAFTSMPVVDAIATFSYQYNAVATDPDPGDVVSFALLTGPTGATIAPGGDISWNPTVAQVGTHPFEIRATDNNGNSALQSFVVEVHPGPGTLTCSPLEGRCNQLPPAPFGSTFDEGDPERPGILAPQRYSDFVPVGLYNGELRLSRTDLRVPSRGFAFEWRRVYSSRAVFTGAHGRNWTLSFDRRIHDVGNLGIICWIVDGRGREDEYVAGSNGVLLARGRYEELLKNPDGTYLQYGRDGMCYEYDIAGLLAAMRDRHGNTLMITRNSFGNIVRIVDTQDRLYTVGYSNGTAANDYNDGTADQRITTVTDFRGRIVTYAYDTEDRLAAVTTPAVTGTPNGNDYPLGKTTLYSYTSGNIDPLLNHNLLCEVQPAYNVANDPLLSKPWFLITYNADDEVESFRWGHDDGGAASQPTTIVGGTLSFQRETSLAGDMYAPALATLRNRVTDPNGNIVDHYFNNGCREIRTRVLTNRNVRPAEGDYQLEYDYDLNGLLLRAVLPRGNEHTYAYDTNHPSPRARANLLERRHRKGTLGPVDDLTWRWTYDPIYNQIRTVSDPRAFPTGLVPLTAAGRLDLADALVDRYTRKSCFDYQEGFGFQSAQGVDPTVQLPEGLGDLNGAPDFDAGNVVATKIAIQTPGANFGDLLEEFRRYNQFGQILEELDGNGVSTQYTYYASNGTPLDPSDREGYLQQRTQDPAGLAVSTVYDVDESGNVIAELDPNGHTTTHIYNALDQLMQTLSPVWAPNGVGHSISRSYDANDRMTALARENLDESGTTYANPVIATMREYNILGRLVVTEEDRTHNDGSTPGVARTERSYDANMNLTALERPNGSMATFLYDERDQRYKAIVGNDPATAEETTFNYDANRNLTELIDAIHDSTSPNAPTTLFPGSGSGDVIQIDHDCYDRIKSLIDGEGTVWSLEYDRRSHVTRRFAHGLPNANPGAIATLLRDLSFSYDEAGRRVSRTDSHFEVLGGAAIGDGARSTSYTYDLARNLIASTDDLGSVTSHSYDALQRRTGTTDALGNSTTWSYDANSNVVTQTCIDVSTDLGSSPDVLVTTFTYDPRNLLIERDDPTTGRVTYAYDSARNPTLSTDALSSTPQGLGNKTRRTFNGLGQLVCEIKELTATGWGGAAVIDTLMTCWTRDANGNVTSQQDPNGNVTTYNYNDRNRLDAITLADNSVYLYDHDRDGRIASWIDPNGTVAQHTHDGMGRLVRILLTLALGVIGPVEENYGYDGVGRRTLEQNTWVFATREYDSHDNCILENQNGRILERDYDALRTLKELALPGGGTTLHYTHDALRRALAIADGAEQLIELHYKGRERVERRDDIRNGAPFSYSHYAYGMHQRMVEILHEKANGSAIDHRQYGFDAAGNTQFEKIVSNSNLGRVFYRDSIRRLAKAYSNLDLTALQPGQTLMPNAVTGSDCRAYAYDNAGNRTTVDLIVGGSTTTTTYTSGTVNQYTQTQTTGLPASNLQYDANGNLISDGTYNYSYDFRNQLVSVSLGFTPILQFVHDNRGRVVIKSSLLPPFGQSTYVWNDNDLVQEVDLLGNVLAENVWLHGRLLQRLTAAGRQHVYTRLDRSISKVLDGNCVELAAFDYTPFGERVSTSVASFPFAYRGTLVCGTFDSIYPSLEGKAFSTALGRDLSRRQSRDGVTYSRSLGPAFDGCPPPIQVVDTDHSLELSGTTNLGEILRAIAPTADLLRTQRNDGAPRLRSLGSPSQLVLINGRRRASEGGLVELSELELPNVELLGSEAFRDIWNRFLQMRIERLFGDRLERERAEVDRTLFGSRFLRGVEPEGFPVGAPDNLDSYLLIGSGNNVDGAYLPRNYDSDIPGQNADLPLWRS
ncbi:MAG: DUF6531 domain-containing protein [Planctomycetota bacterium]